MNSQAIFPKNNDDIENTSLPVIQIESFETNVILIPEEQQLLINWGCEELLSDFIEKGIDVECLKEMSEFDIQNLIPSAKYGLRIKFRSRLLNWRKENIFSLFPLSDTLFMGSRIPSWISSSSFSENIQSSPSSSLQSSFEIHPTEITLTENKTIKTLEQILQISIVGKSILDIISKEGLSFKSRNDLCELIAHFRIIEFYSYSNWYTY